MCINYTNEKLHKLFISATFDAEKAELANEGLHECIDNLNYPEKTGVEVLRLLDHKAGLGDKVAINGLFTMVNDASK